MKSFQQDSKMDDAMRKILILLLVVFVAFQAFASVPQKIHPVDSPLYRIIKDVYLMTGHAMPSSTGPWSSAELDAMIDRIPESEVPDYLKDGYAKVKSELDRELRRDFGSMSLQFSANTSAELYVHTNTDGLTSADARGMTDAVNRMPQAVQRGMSGIRVLMDGTVVGRLVADEVSRQIAGMIM